MPLEGGAGVVTACDQRGLEGGNGTQVSHHRCPERTMNGAAKVKTPFERRCRRSYAKIRASVRPPILRLRPKRKID